MRSPLIGFGVRTRLVAAGTASLVILSAGGASALSANTAAPEGPPKGCSATWPMYQHDASHTASGCSQLSPSSVPTLHPGWFTPTNGAVTAEPTVASGTVFVGDSTGVFHALDQTTGASRWTFAVTSPQTCYRDQPAGFADKHAAGFGTITSSANYSDAVTDPAGHPMVFFGAGGSVMALDAVTGKCQWAQDIDPADPTNALEVESSPVIDTAVSPPELLVGSDDNTASGITVTGFQAFDAATGALLWRYEPERDVTLTPSEFGGSEAMTLSCGDGTTNPNCDPSIVKGIGQNSKAWADACGDVWSSPSLDTNFVDPAGSNSYQSVDTAAATDPAWFPKQITASGHRSPDGLVVFGTGNCAADPRPSTTYAHSDYAHGEGLFALDPVTGVRVWNWFEPVNLYNTGSPNEGGGGDTDFGGSSILATVLTKDLPKNVSCGQHGDSTDLVIQGGKSGYAYAVCENDGSEVWQVQAAQPGQISPEIIGAGGGFIGSPSLGVSKGRAAAFFNAALPLPFADDGFREPGDGDDAGATCPGPAGQRLPLLPACPDPSIANNPARLLSLVALDVANGSVIWRAPSTPSYAATTYSNGIVFAASTTSFAAEAYNADNGLPLWVSPVGGAIASGTSIVGQSVFVGSGLAETNFGPNTLPPGNNGIWSFTTAAAPLGTRGIPVP
jgi:outer membrane protein assembly factor BamB